VNKYTVKLILWKHDAAKNGLFPIYIKTTIARKTSYKATGHFTTEKNWDDKNGRLRSGPNSMLINVRLVTMLSEWEEKIIQQQIKGIELSAGQIKKSFKRDYTNIFDFVEAIIERGKKSPATFENYRKHLKKLEAFSGSRVLNFESVNPTFLHNYEVWLRTHIKYRSDSVQKNYVHAIWKTLKTWFNAAKKEGIISHYPFDQYENPVYVSPDKDFLTVLELQVLEKFADECTDPVLKQTAVYFLFGCYSGMRISDWFQFDRAKHIKIDKLRLRPTKTKNKWVEMIISMPLKRNFGRMVEMPLTIAEPTINEKLKIIADKLKIKKHVTTHTGRHTFAVTICLGNGLSSETSAELMGITLQTFVKNYSQVTQVKIDAETREAWRELL
jgi:site-specific recombinase XerD